MPDSTEDATGKPTTERQSFDNLSPDRSAANKPGPERKASTEAERFARQAEEAPPGLLAEFWDFLLHNKKWWLTPIILVLLLAALFVILSGTAAGPLIYPGL